MLHINKINIVDSRLRWRNYEQVGQGEIKFTQLTLSDVNTENRPFNLNLEANLSSHTKKDIQLKLTSRNQLNLENKTLAVNYDSHINDNITAQGQLNIHLTHSMPFEGNIKTIGNLIGQLDKTTANSTSLLACAVKGDKNMLNFNDCTISHGKNNAKANIQLLNWTDRKKRTLQGNIRADQLRIKHLRIHNFDTHLMMHHHRWQFNPISAALYQGTYQGQLTVNTRNNVTYQLKQKINGVQLQPLLKDMHKAQTVTGTFSSFANLNTQGNDTATMKQQLDGRANFTITQGNIQGLNINSLMQNAYDLFKHNDNSTINRSGQTSFAEITADFNIANGIANTKNLDLTSKLAYVTAAGHVNLVNENINFQAEVHLNNDSLPQIDFLQKQTGGSIPFLITGTIDKPTIQPDMAGLTKMLSRSGLQKNLNKVSKQIDKTSDNLSKQLKAIFD